jgi:hypothetical protein
MHASLSNHAAVIQIKRAPQRGEHDAARRDAEEHQIPDARARRIKCSSFSENAPTHLIYIHVSLAAFIAILP